MAQAQDAPPAPEFFQSGSSGSSQQSSASSQSTSESQTFQAIMPFILELLDKSQGRRDTARGTAKDILSALVSIAPNAAGDFDTVPGFERGGIADILGGIVSGKGTVAFGENLPDSFRQPSKITLPVSALNIQDPDVPSEVRSLLPTNKILMDLVRSFMTGDSSSQASSVSQSSGSSGSTSTSQINPFNSDSGLSEEQFLARVGLIPPPNTETIVPGSSSIGPDGSIFGPPGPNPFEGIDPSGSIIGGIFNSLNPF